MDEANSEASYASLHSSPPPQDDDSQPESSPPRSPPPERGEGGGEEDKGGGGVGGALPLIHLGRKEVVESTYALTLFGLNLACVHARVCKLVS